MNNMTTPILFPESVEECSFKLHKAKQEVSEIASRSFVTQVSACEEMIAQFEANMTNVKKAKARILHNLKKAEEELSSARMDRKFHSTQPTTPRHVSIGK